MCDTQHPSPTHTQDRIRELLRDGSISLSEEPAVDVSAGYSFNDIVLNNFGQAKTHKIELWSCEKKTTIDPYGINHMPFTYNYDNKEESVRSCGGNEKDKTRPESCPVTHTGMKERKVEK